MTIRETGQASASHSVITLDVAGVRADSDAVQRLVSETARRAFASSQSLAAVEVQDRAGNLLGRVSRQRVPVVRDVAEVQNPQMHKTPDIPMFEHDELRSWKPPGFDARERPTPHRPLADRFVLPGAVRDMVHAPDDAVDLVRAILTASGRAVVVDEDVLLVDDVAIIVVDVRSPAQPSRDALNHAYFRFRRVARPFGVALTLGYMDPADTQRRERLAPELIHVGSSAIQRMADAVAIGADPMEFIIGTPIVDGRSPTIRPQAPARHPDSRAG